MKTLDQIETLNNNKDLFWKSNSPLTQEVVNDTSIKTLRITEDAWIEKIIKIINLDDYLNDLFFINNKWQIVVRHDSEVLKWHFKGNPISPWVLIAKLFNWITWNIINDWESTLVFEWILWPWDIVDVHYNWVKLNWKEILKITYKKDSIYEINKTSWENEIIDFKNYLMQSYPFLLAKNTKLFNASTELNTWETIEWEINISYINDNWYVDEFLLLEWLAQVLSAWVCYKANNWKTIKETWDNFSIMTLKSFSYKLYKDVDIDKAYIKSKLVSVDWRNIIWVFKIINSKWELIMKWEIEWTLVKKMVLSRQKRKQDNKKRLENF